jgi:hypothetical protein
MMVVLYSDQGKSIIHGVAYSETARRLYGGFGMPRLRGELGNKYIRRPQPMPPISLCSFSFYSGIIAGNFRLRWLLYPLSLIHTSLTRFDERRIVPKVDYNVRRTFFLPQRSDKLPRIFTIRKIRIKLMGQLWMFLLACLIQRYMIVLAAIKVDMQLHRLANILLMVCIARPIDLENEINDYSNFISETTHVSATEHAVAPESGDYNNGTDQEPASKGVSTLNSVGSPIFSPPGFDVITFAGSLPSRDGGDSTLAGEPEISSPDGFGKPDEEYGHENESAPQGCTIIVECDEVHGAMQPRNQTLGDNTMRKASLAATRDDAGSTQGLRYPKRKRASIVDKTAAHQSQSKRQRLSPPDSENDSSSSEDDDDDDADYELNETRNDDGYVSSPSSACDSEERPVQSVCSDEIINPEMLIPVYIPQKYLRYLALQQSMHSATARVKSRNLERKPESVKATGTRYTEDDDRQLLELKEERGMSWQEIQREYFPQREINSLQVHYCTKVNSKRKKNHVLHA